MADGNIPKNEIAVCGDWTTVTSIPTTLQKMSLIYFTSNPNVQGVLKVSIKNENLFITAGNQGNGMVFVPKGTVINESQNVYSVQYIELTS